MHHHSLVWGQLVVLAFTLASCVEASAPAEAPEGPVPLVELADATARVACRSHARCCREQGGGSFDGSACVGRIRRVLGLKYAAAERAGVPYDAEAAGDCVRAVAAADCAELLTVTQVCREAFRGTQPPGTRCSTSLECSWEEGDHYWCEEEGSDETVCILLPLATEGDACKWTCTDRGSGLGCGADLPEGHDPVQPRCMSDHGLFCSDAHVCQRLGAAGAACTRSDACMDPLICVDDVCTDKPSQGQECNGVLGCQPGLYCAEGFVCNPSLPPGSSCIGRTNECAGGFCRDGECQEGDEADLNPPESCVLGQ